MQRLQQSSPIGVVGLDEEPITRTAEAEPHTDGSGGIIVVHVDVEALETENGLRNGAIDVSVGFVVPLMIALEARHMSSRTPSIHGVDEARVPPEDIGWRHVHFISLLRTIKCVCQNLEGEE